MRFVSSGVALDLCDCCTCKARVTSTVKVLSLFKSKHRPTQVCVRLESKAPSDTNLWIPLSVVRFVSSVSSGVALDDSMSKFEPIPRSHFVSARPPHVATQTTHLMHV